MNHLILKTVINDMHEVIKEADIVDREYVFEKNVNYVLIGIRRAGKSTLLYKIVRDLIAEGVDWSRIIYVNFEDERLTEFSLEDFNDLVATAGELTSEKPYFFLDEVQNIPGWERFARRMADAREHVYITGSNAEMLSHEMESRLGGRYMTMHVYPYNFREYLTASKLDYSESAYLTTKLNGRIRSAAQSYLTDGGFPESLMFVNRRSYVENIYQKILSESNPQTAGAWRPVVAQQTSAAFARVCGLHEENRRNRHERAVDLEAEWDDSGSRRKALEGYGRRICKLCRKCVSDF